MKSPRLPSLVVQTWIIAVALSHATAAETPNVVYIMADELGYFEPAFMGGKNIDTPNIDRMAADGISFTNLLAGSSVCAPTRCTFLTGKHDYLYWEIGQSVAVRMENWRAIRQKSRSPWELYDLSTDPSESDNLAAKQPGKLAQLVALAERAHEPVREGTFASTDRHERDRRAKFGRHDEKISKDK